MAGVLYENVIDELLARFPEFRETVQYDFSDPDIPYSIWGGFGAYATDRIRRLPAEALDDHPFVIRLFDMANGLLGSDDLDTQTIVVIELLEQIATYRKTYDVGLRKLKPRHASWLERQVHGVWQTHDLHYEGELIAPGGLDPLATLLSGCSWPVLVKRFEPGGAPRLEANDDRIELTMEPGSGPRHKFFGAAMFLQGESTKSRKTNAALSLLGDLSSRLASGDIRHRLALYRCDDRKDVLLDYFHHRWPQSDNEGLPFGS